MSCTFKNDKAPTGLARVGWTMGADIKYKKQKCGMIVPPSHWTREGKYRIRLTVVDGDMWSWVTLKAQFDSLQEAKDWCKEHWESLMQRYNLHFMSKE